MAFKGDCSTLAKTADDEPIFVLAARDMLAPGVVRLWIKNAEAGGVPSDKVDEARACLAEMIEWQRDNGVRRPD